MPHSTVIHTKKDHIGYITLNRPEADNSINLKLAQGLEDVCLKIIRMMISMLLLLLEPEIKLSVVAASLSQRN